MFRLAAHPGSASESARQENQTTVPGGWNYFTLAPAPGTFSQMTLLPSKAAA